MEKKIALIGCGNCGSQICDLAERKYPELFDCVYINSSESDLAMIANQDALKFKIGNKDEVEGSGKNRLKMKQYLKDDCAKIFNDENLRSIISSKKYVFICTSAAGGTGSGAAPILMDLLSKLFPDTNFILVGVLPQLNASLMEQGNALEFLNEMYDGLEDITYMLYDNECTANLPATKALEEVNRQIVEDIRVLSGIDNYPTPYESIDEADLESIITTPGRLLVTRITNGLTEKAMEDNNLDEIIIKAIKRSAQVETDRNKRVVRWGVITYFTDEVNSLYIPTMEGLVNFLGTPVERFNHNAINNSTEDLNFLYLIASGLSPINDRVKKITEKIAKLKEALASDKTNQYILSGEGASYSTLEERRKADKQSKQVDTIDAEAIFNKFMNL